MIDKHRYHRIKHQLIEHGVEMFEAARLARLAAEMIPLVLTSTLDSGSPDLEAVSVEQRIRDLQQLSDYNAAGVITKDIALVLSLSELYSLDHTYYGAVYVAGYQTWRTDGFGITYAIGTGGCPVGPLGAPGVADGPNADDGVNGDL